MMALLLSPMSWVMAAMLALLLSRHLRRWRKLVLASAALLAVAGLFGVTPLGANLLVATLETSANAESQAACVATAPSVIVVLAGGADRVPSDGRDFSALSAASLRRLAAAVAVWREQPQRTLIIAGGRTFPGSPADSTLMQAFALALGVPADVVRVETRSTTTWENARNVVPLSSTSRIWLVTSALHMRRARYAFAQAGFQTCPYPTDQRFVAFGLPGGLVPQAGAAMKSERALHEWVGLAYYHWLAWRDSEGVHATRE